MTSHTPLYRKIRVLRMNVTPLRASAMVDTGTLLYRTKGAGFWSSGMARSNCSSLHIR